MATFLWRRSASRRIRWPGLLYPAAAAAPRRRGVRRRVGYAGDLCRDYARRAVATPRVVRAATASPATSPVSSCCATAGSPSSNRFHDRLRSSVGTRSRDGPSHDAAQRPARARAARRVGARRRDRHVRERRLLRRDRRRRRHRARARAHVLQGHADARRRRDRAADESGGRLPQRGDDLRSHELLHGAAVVELRGGARRAVRRLRQLADRRGGAGARARGDHPGGEAEGRQPGRGGDGDAVRAAARPAPHPAVAHRARARAACAHARRDARASIATSTIRATRCSSSSATSIPTRRCGDRVRATARCPPATPARMPGPDGGGSGAGSAIASGRATSARRRSPSAGARRQRSTTRRPASICSARSSAAAARRASTAPCASASSRRRSPRTTTRRRRSACSSSMPRRRADRAADAARAIWAQLRDVRENGVSEGELARAKRVFEARWIRRLEDMEGQAQLPRRMGGARRLVAGRRLPSPRARRDDGRSSRRLARRFLDPDQARWSSSTGPKNGAEVAPRRGRDARAARRRARRSRAEPAVLAAARGAGDRDRAARRARGGRRPRLPYRRRGSRCSCDASRARSCTPACTCSAARATSRRPHAGLTSLLVRTALKGTGAAHARLQIAEEAELLGGSVTGAAGGRELRLDDQRAGAPRGAGDRAARRRGAACRPFPDDALETERAIALADLVALRDDMYRYPVRLATQAAFAGHPYGVPPTGDERTLPTITADDAARVAPRARARGARGDRRRRRRRAGGAGRARGGRVRRAAWRRARSARGAELAERRRAARGAAREGADRAGADVPGSVARRRRAVRRRR